jgi:hypothetical protein
MHAANIVPHFFDIVARSGDFRQVSVANRMDCIDRIVDSPVGLIDELANLVTKLVGALRELPNFVRDDCESATSSPARAASMAALRADRSVCEVMSLTSFSSFTTASTLVDMEEKW